MPRGDSSRSTSITASLLLGFGLTLGLWLFAGFQFTRRMSQVQNETSEINARYVEAQELLSGIRAQVLLGSIYLRDALLDPDPAKAAEYRGQLEKSYNAIDEALRRYRPVWNVPEERERVERLRSEIEGFRATIREVLAGDSRFRTAEAGPLLRTRIVPRREVVIRVSQEVEALNQAEFLRQQADSMAISRTARRRVWQQVGAALALNVAIALVAILYAGRLEGRLRRETTKNLETSRTLQRLSNQLIRAQEEERRTISRELHDEIGQALTAIKVEIAVAQKAIQAGGGPDHVLDDARSIVDGALQSTRDLSHLLHPALLDDLGLAAAVDWYLSGFSKRHGIRTELLEQGMDARLGADIETAAYRIIQEALTNVAKHARASSCRIYLQRLATTIIATIEDDGIGFEPGSPLTAEGRRGLGLIGIRERASQLGGTLRLESTMGKGTRLTVELPARPRTPSTQDANVSHAAVAPGSIGG